MADNITRKFIKELFFASLPHGFFDVGGTFLAFYIAAQIGLFTHGWMNGMSGIHEWWIFFKEYRWGIVGSVFYMLIMGHLSIRRKNMEEISKLQSMKKNVEIMKIMRIFDTLIMQGYEIGPSGPDAWINSSKEFLEKLFGKDSYEVKVFKKEVTDAVVTKLFRNQKAKFELLKGGRLAPPSVVFRDEDGSIIFQMVTMRWARDRFVEKNPLTNV